MRPTRCTGQKAFKEASGKELVPSVYVIFISDFECVSVSSLIFLPFIKMTIITLATCVPQKKEGGIMKCLSGALNFPE